MCQLSVRNRRVQSGFWVSTAEPNTTLMKVTYFSLLIINHHLQSVWGIMMISLQNVQCPPTNTQGKPIIYLRYGLGVDHLVTALIRSGCCLWCMWHHVMGKRLFYSDVGCNVSADIKQHFHSFGGVLPATSCVLVYINININSNNICLHSY